MGLQFSPKPIQCWSAEGFATKYKLCAYTTPGVNFPVESNQCFDSREACQMACDLANAGNEGGLTFASYSDD